jgi:hypothetical protein
MKKVKIIFIAFLVGATFLFSGCDFFGSGTTIEFRVNNNLIVHEDNVITKIEFFNGANENAPMIETLILNLEGKQMSNTFKVSGFTELHSGENYIFGVKVTFIGGQTIFGWSSTVHNGKININLSNFLSLIISFSKGNW